MGPEVVYEDGNMIVCNKPAGMPSQSDRSFDADLLGAVRTYRSERGDTGETYIINRLDKPVGGLVLFALNKRTASALSAMSGERSIEKCYYAAVKGEMQSGGIFTDWLLKDTGGNFSRAVKEGTPGAKKAVLSCEPLETRALCGQEYTLVKIRLHTGRHHQIRVQLARRGHGIYGDIKYNPDFAGKRGVMPALFAYRLSFNNPSGAERVTVEIKPSGGIWDSFGAFEP